MQEVGGEWEAGGGGGRWGERVEERGRVWRRGCARRAAHSSSFSIACCKNNCAARQQPRELPRVRREWLARPAHLPLRVHEAAWGHGRQEARRLCVLRRRRHLERKRRRYARHAAAFTPLSPRCALSAPRNSCDREEKRGTGLFLVVVVTENQSLHTREQAHTKLHAHATNTIRAGPVQSQSVRDHLR